MKLLINADDLGYTPVINRAIFDLHSRGRLSSTSLLVNLRHSQNAIDGLRALPDLRVGVHLNLTKGYPMLPTNQTSSLVGAAGEFWPTKSFFARAVTGRLNLPEIESELRAQIEFALDSGIQPTHLDSHSHWHLLPSLQRLIFRLAEGYQISGVRQSALRRTLIPSRFWLAIVTRKDLPQSEIRIPDYLLSLHQWMDADGQPNPLFFSQQVRHLAEPGVTLELVTHPGKFHDLDFPPDTLLTHQRQWEIDFLLSPPMNAWLEMMEATIVNYQTI